MGREAYLMRLALGRSPLEHPEDSDTFTAARAGDWTSALHAVGDDSVLEAGSTANTAQEGPPPYGQLYDARGHPFNPWARRSGRQLIEAQNDILSVIGVTERKIPFDGPRDFDHDMIREALDPDEDFAGEVIGYAAEWEYQFSTWWVHALSQRLLVFPPKSDAFFLDLLEKHFVAMGTTQTRFGTLSFVKFMFAGVPSFVLGHFINPEMWTQQLLYSLDRAVMASVSSKEWRDRYIQIRPAAAVVIEIVLNLFILPFRLHATLELLGFEPRGILGLPRPNSWIPFVGQSPIRWGPSLRPLLPFFAYRPIYAIVSRYLYKSSWPAFLKPVDIAHHRRSSGYRYASSINSAPMIELPNLDNGLNAIFRHVFGFLGWGQRPYASENTDTVWNPGLCRRETWPVNHDAEADLEVSEPEQSQDATTQTGGTVEETAFPESINPLSSTQRLPQEHSSPVQTHRGDTDATIRVSSIDPETGAVNLEIGLPDTGIAHQALHPSTVEPTRRHESDIFHTPHRLSKLALEPTERLAELTNGWVTSWLLMPLRAITLRTLVCYVMINPGFFGVNAARANALPGLLGSDLSVVRYAGFRGVGKVALSCLVDVALGLGFWLVEWAAVREIGIQIFGWGTF